MKSETAIKYEALTSQIINAFYHVYNVLGHGFLEKVYRNALRNELRKRGFFVDDNCKIDVLYDGAIVGEYIADLIVNDTVILETKAVENLIEEHECQLINYLKATRIEVGLLFNFGPKPQLKRKLFDHKPEKTQSLQSAMNPT